MIRPACEADSDNLANLIYKMIAELEHIGELKMTGKSVAVQTLKNTLAEEIGNSEYQHVLALKDDTDAIVGCGAGQIINLGPLWKINKVLHIDVVYVKSECRNQGLGEDIVKSLIAWGEAGNCEYSELNVLANNKASGFYKKLGFQAYRHHLVRSK